MMEKTVKNSWTTPGCYEVCPEKNTWDDVYIPGMKELYEKSCWSEGHTAVYLPPSNWDIALQVSGIVLWCFLIAVVVLAIADFIRRVYGVLETLEEARISKNKEPEVEEKVDDEQHT